MLNRLARLIQHAALCLSLLLSCSHASAAQTGGQSNSSRKSAPAATTTHDAASSRTAPSSKANGAPADTKSNATTANVRDADDSSVVATAGTPVTHGAGIVRIGLALPKTNLAQGAEAAETLRATLTQYLKGPAADTISLDALVPVQQRAEAAGKSCAFVLSVSIMQKKSGGGEGLSSVLRKSAPATSGLLDDLGTGKSAQMAARIGRKSQTTLMTVADLSAGIKAKDEVTLDYSLTNTASGESRRAGSFKARAKVDGENILGNLIEQAAEAALTEALKK